MTEVDLKNLLGGVARKQKRVEKYQEELATPMFPPTQPSTEDLAMARELLDEALELAPTNEFVQSLASFLETRRFLTKKQIIALENFVNTRRNMTMFMPQSQVQGTLPVDMTPVVRSSRRRSAEEWVEESKQRQEAFVFKRVDASMPPQERQQVAPPRKPRPVTTAQPPRSAPVTDPGPKRRKRKFDLDDL